MCHNTLLAGSYTKGSDAGSLICSHHVTDSKNTPADFNQQIRSTANQPRCTSQTGYFSLGGLAITSIPLYTKQTESQDRLVCRIADMEGDEKEECNRENRDCTVKQESKVKNPEPPTPSVADRTVGGAENAGQAASLADGEVQQEVAETQELAKLSSSCAQVTEGSSQPDSAPRRMSDSSAVPRPASRNKTSQTTSSSPAAGKQALYYATAIYLLSVCLLCEAISVFLSLSLRRQAFTQCDSHVSKQRVCSLLTFGTDSNYLLYFSGICCV